MSKRNKNNNKHSFTKDVTETGPIRCFLEGAIRIEVAPLSTALSVQSVYVVPSQVPQATVF